MHVRTQVNEQLDSDIQELHEHPSKEEFDPAHSYIFPLGGDGPYLCTQVDLALTVCVALHCI